MCAVFFYWWCDCRMSGNRIEKCGADVFRGGRWGCCGAEKIPRLWGILIVFDYCFGGVSWHFPVVADTETLRHSGSSRL